MSITDDLLGAVRGDAPVEQVIVGIHWTMVTVSRGAGLASTLAPADQHHGTQSVKRAGELEGESALKLAGMLRSELPMERSIGMAALNALLEVDDSRCVELNAEDWLLQHGEGKRVAVVGHFPFIPRLKGVPSKLWVLEQRPGEGDLPEERAPEVIPEAEIVAVTGMTIVNGTLEGILRLRRPGATVMLLGPSTPLAPVLHDHGIQIISGTQVVDPRAVAPFVAQGAIFRQIKRSGGVRLLTMLSEIN